VTTSLGGVQPRLERFRCAFGERLDAADGAPYRARRAGCNRMPIAGDDAGAC